MFQPILFPRFNMFQLFQQISLQNPQPIKARTPSVLEPAHNCNIWCYNTRHDQIACNSRAHSTHFHTFQHHHFARTKVSTLDILGPIYVSGCKRSCASMYDEHMIPKILTRPAASRMIRSTSQQAALSLSDSISLSDRNRMGQIEIDRGASGAWLRSGTMCLAAS